MKSLVRYSVLLHIIGWVFFISLPLLMFPVNNLFSQPNLKIFVIPQLISTFLLIIVFYLNLNFFVPNLLFTKNSLLFLVFLLVGFVILYIANSLMFEYIFKPNLHLLQSPKHLPALNEKRPHRLPITFNPRIFGTVLSYILVITASSMLVLVRDRTRGKEENQRVILEKTAAELAVLKLQISPHFLFNTLNNIRWLARQKSEKTEDAVVKLSQLLRYMIYQTSNDKVPLEQEIEHLNNYISLQKMRLTDKDLVEFVCEGEMSKIMIEPLLFIAFVENAFKYGLHNAEKSLIKIGIHVFENTLNFYAENSVFGENMPKENENSGIGIKNVEVRLALLYPNKHELQINNKEDTFRVDLKINLA